MDDKKLFTRAAIAKMFGVRKKTLEYLVYIKNGPKFYRIGRHCLYKPDEFEDWLQKCRKVDPANSNHNPRRRPGRPRKGPKTRDREKAQKDARKIEKEKKDDT